LMVPREFGVVPSFPAGSVCRAGGFTVVAVSGDIGAARTPVLREQLLGLLRPGACWLVVDVSGVTFCDAGGVAVLVGVARRAGLMGGVLRLAGPAPLMSAVLRVTGLDSRFEIFAAVPEAVGAGRPGAGDAGVFPAQVSLPA
jgi:anti-sigma B factor antagonist